MPRKAINYQNTIMYKIVCNDLEIPYTYVGHTTDFVKRKTTHKSNCNNENSKSYNYKIYQIIRENGGWDNFSMIQIEKYKCNDVNEACARERFWYEELNAKLNTRVPNRTDKECLKEYYEKNKNKILQKGKELVLCQCGKTYTRNHKSRHLKTNYHINFVEQAEAILENPN